MVANAGQRYCRMLPLEHSAILLIRISDNWSWKQFLVFLRVAVLDRFYCKSFWDAALSADFQPVGKCYDSVKLTLEYWVFDVVIKCWLGCGVCWYYIVNFGVFFSLTVLAHICYLFNHFLASRHIVILLTENEKKRNMYSIWSFVLFGFLYQINL